MKNEEHGAESINNTLFVELAKASLSSAESRLIFGLLARVMNERTCSFNDEVSFELLAAYTNTKTGNIRRVVARLSERNILVVRNDKCRFNLDCDVWKLKPIKVRSGVVKAKACSSKTLSKSSNFEDSTAVSPSAAARFDAQALPSCNCNPNHLSVSGKQPRQPSRYSLLPPSYPSDGKTQSLVSVVLNGMPLTCNESSGNAPEVVIVARKSRRTNGMAVVKPKGVASSVLGLWSRVLKVLRGWLAI